jgi:hypothetical protein
MIDNSLYARIVTFLGQPDNVYKELSTNGKLLLMLLHDRLQRDYQSDESGNLYIVFLTAEVKSMLNLRKAKNANRVIQELLDHQLIEVNNTAGEDRIYLADLFTGNIN